MVAKFARIALAGAVSLAFLPDAMARPSTWTLTSIDLDGPQGADTVQIDIAGVPHEITLTEHSPTNASVTLTRNGLSVGNLTLDPLNRTLTGTLDGVQVDFPYAPPLVPPTIDPDLVWLTGGSGTNMTLPQRNPDGTIFMPAMGEAGWIHFALGEIYPGNDDFLDDLNLPWLDLGDMFGGEIDVPDWPPGGGAGSYPTGPKPKPGDPLPVCAPEPDRTASCTYNGVTDTATCECVEAKCEIRTDGVLQRPNLPPLYFEYCDCFCEE